jgi:hypothetical protein
MWSPLRSRKASITKKRSPVSALQSRTCSWGICGAMAVKHPDGDHLATIGAAHFHAMAGFARMPIAPMTHRCFRQFGSPTRPMGPPVISDVAAVNIGQCIKNLMEKKTIR